MRQHVVYCYAEGRENHWEAICVNFDLAVQGRTFHEVYASLNVAIEEYLRYVHSLPLEEQLPFLERKVPFWTRLEFAIRTFIDALRSRDGGANHRHGYTLPCEA